jgi:hypothetical protein
MSSSGISSISPVGLPSNLQYTQLPSVPDSVNSYSVSVAPSGLTSVSGATISTTVFVANNAGLVNQLFNPQNIDFTIPAGMNENVFLDTQQTTLSFKMKIVVTTASSVTGGALKLISSASSFFDSLTLSSNNIPIDQVYNYNLLFNQLLTSSVNFSERYGQCSVSMGCDTNTYSGIDLPHSATGTYWFNFSVPLISIIGLNTAGTSNKLFPIGSVGALTLRMTTANLLPFCSYCTAITTQPVFTVSLESFNLDMKYIDIGDIAGSMLRQTLPNGMYYIKSSTYVGANASVPTGTFGNVSIPLQIRNSSMKSLYIQFGIATSAKCPNGYYDAVNPNLISLQLNIGGKKKPNRPLNPSLEPASCFINYMEAWGKTSTLDGSGCVYRGSYGATLNTVTNSDSLIVVPATGQRAISQIENATYDIIVHYPNTHFIGFDTERITGSLFSGVDTRFSPPYLECNIATTLTDNVTCYAFALLDCVIKIDPQQKTCEVLV